MTHTGPQGRTRTRRTSSLTPASARAYGERYPKLATAAQQFGQLNEEQIRAKIDAEKECELGQRLLRTVRDEVLVPVEQHRVDVLLVLARQVKRLLPLVEAHAHLDGAVDPPGLHEDLDRLGHAPPEE